MPGRAEPGACGVGLDAQIASGARAPVLEHTLAQKSFGVGERPSAAQHCGWSGRVAVPLVEQGAQAQHHPLR